MIPDPISENDARAIYRILCEECGALEYGLEDFVRSCDEITEYRFQGRLGFGGKFWNYGGRWYVTCYSEDQTPKRRAMINAAGRRLVELKEQARKERE